MPAGPKDLFSDLSFRRKLLGRIEDGWTFGKIEPMSTEEVFARLNRLGVATTPDDFQQAAQYHDSAQPLAAEWRTQYILRPEDRHDEDFLDGSLPQPPAGEVWASLPKN